MDHGGGYEELLQRQQQQQEQQQQHIGLQQPYFHEDEGQEKMVQFSAYFVLFSGLLTLVLVLAKFLHDRPRLNTIFPEAALILTVGMIAGSLINLFLYWSTSSSTLPLLDSSNDNYNNSNSYIITDNDSDSFVAKSLLSFSPRVFFLYLLPPIIFNSGYHLRRELFFRHIVPICLFAIVGTTISAVTIAVFLYYTQKMGLSGSDSFQPYFTELLTFGGLISATDPVSTLAVFQVKCVDPQLFYLVFGESVLNDAVGLVLFNGFSKFVGAFDTVNAASIAAASNLFNGTFSNQYNSNTTTNAVAMVEDASEMVAIDMGEFIISFVLDSIGSPLLGIVCSCGSALLFKYANMREHKLLELSAYVLIMYVPFLVAEVLGLSAIVTILFSGMAARSYVVPNLSEETVRTSETLFRLFAHVAETSIFLELGLSVFSLAPGAFEGSFIGWALIACLVGRILNVYPITFFYNLYVRLLVWKEESHRKYSQASVTDDDDDDGIYCVNENVVEMTMLSSHSQMYDKDEIKNKKDKSSVGRLSNNSNKDNISSSSTTTTTKASNSKKIVTHKPSLSEQMDSHSNNDTDSSSSCDGQSLHLFFGEVDDNHHYPHRDLIIAPKTAHMMCFSGLRGAVAYACVRSFPDLYGNRTEFIVTTMVIVLVTVFVLGGTTDAMLQLLKIEINVDENKYMEDWYRYLQGRRGCIVSLEHFIQRYVVVRRSSVVSTNISEVDCANVHVDDEHEDDEHIISMVSSTASKIKKSQLSTAMTTPTTGGTETETVVTTKRDTDRHEENKIKCDQYNDMEVGRVGAESFYHYNHHTNHSTVLDAVPQATNLGNGGIAESKQQQQQQYEQKRRNRKVSYHKKPFPSGTMKFATLVSTGTESLSSSSSSLSYDAEDLTSSFDGTDGEGGIVQETSNLSRVSAVVAAAAGGGSGQRYHQQHSQNRPTRHRYHRRKSKKSLFDFGGTVLQR